MAWQLKNKRLQPQGPGGLLSNSSSLTNSILNNNSSLSSSTPSSNVNILTGNNSSHLANHLDASEDMVRQFAASQIDTQKTAFMRWVNVQLATTTAYGPMTTIEKDLKDGKRLIGLLEVVSKEPLKPERGNMRIHQMANVSKALSFLEKKTDEPLQSIGNEDIVDGNVKLTLGLIWIIIYRFQIQHIANTMTEIYPSLLNDINAMEEESSIVASKKKKGASQHQVDAKNALLRWVRLQLDDYSDIIPPIQDFHRSWKTGVAFAALIHRHDPSILPDFYNTILQSPHETIEQSRKTLTAAFDAAFERMALPRLLDPEDLVDVETPDERSIMTYVSEYYLVMSKHQQEQDPVVAEELHTVRQQAKEHRVTTAEENLQAELRRTQEEEDRKKQEELDELERIRLRRLEIEGWSVRAVERAREEEEARKKRKEEEEEKSLQRKLRREAREREKAILYEQTHPGARPSRSAAATTTLEEEEEMGVADEIGELDEHGVPKAIRAPMDPEELARRQVELDEKLERYLHQVQVLLDWVERQDENLPPTPDTSAPLDRSRDLDQFKVEVQQAEEARRRKEDDFSLVHSARDEILDFESPELTSEQVSDVEERWKELDTLWTAFSKRTSGAMDAVQEIQWIVECSQEIDRILSDLQRFQEQLQLTAEKRSLDSLQDRSQGPVLDHQESNVVSIKLLWKRYNDTLSKLLDSETYTAPAHLAQQNEQVTTVDLPNLGTLLVEAHNNLSNDRLLQTFLYTFVLSEEWIEKSVELLVSLRDPSFVSRDVWKSGETVKSFLARDQTRDDHLDKYRTDMTERQAQLEEEKIKLDEFRLGGSEEDGRSQVEHMLPRELDRCAYASRVLDYLEAARTTQALLETAFNAVNGWVLTQPGTEAEETVSKVTASLAQLEATFKSADVQPVVWDSIQIRHKGLSNLVRDLSSCLREKQEILIADKQMKEFLDVTQSCQMKLREFRSHLYCDSPFKGMISDDTTFFDEFSAMVVRVGEEFDVFEEANFANYQEMATAMTASSSGPGSRQDPALVQSKINSVRRLFDDIRALRIDRERDVVNLTECRRIIITLKRLDADLTTVDDRLTALEITDPNQKQTLNGLVDQSNQLSNEFLLIEQGPVFRFISKDDSCAPLLKEIRERQAHITQMQTRLSLGLEIGEQWGLLWDQFTDRVETLQQYLDESEKEIRGRGISSMNGLADGDSNWKKTEDELHDAETANNKTQTSLKEFQRQRMLELSNLKVALHQSVQLSGGIESLDQIRTEQYHEAERMQQKLREHLQRLYLLNNQEGFQLEILGQRLVWSQQLAESEVHLAKSTTSCQAIVEEYTQVVAKCQQSDNTTDLNGKEAEQLTQKMNKISASAATQKEASMDVTLTIYDSLAELATMAAPGETVDPEAPEKKVPLHLEVELYEYKSRYAMLDHHLEYARQVVEHSVQTASFVRMIDVMDSGFLRMETELKAEREANPKTLEKMNAIRKELAELTERQRAVVKMPKPADKVSDVYTESQQSTRSHLEKVLSARLERSAQLSKNLDPHLIGFQALLSYQNGLRQLYQTLNEHDRWVTQSNQKIQSTQEQIKQMFSSWPGDELEQRKYHNHESMVVFDVDEQVVVDELDVLMDEMEKEFAHVQTKKQGFEETKEHIKVALLGATVHSKQLRMELEWFSENLTGRIQQLETGIRTRSLQLLALEKRAAWEKEIEVARSWFKDFAKAVILFAREQSRWKSKHKHADDNISLRSVKTTASRIQVDRLGLSVIEFEDQVEVFETESRPRVDRSWSELCSALAIIARSVPDEFQNRQNALGRDFEDIRKQVSLSAVIVTQRRSLEDMAFRLESLEHLDGLKDELKDDVQPHGVGYGHGYGNGKGNNGNYGNGHPHVAPTHLAVPETKNGRIGADGVLVKTKEKKWSRFQAKVKKLTRR
ncbi:actinin alpha 2 [Linnemannia exigua]|uniref:Actinin alpha 2 n=1 Tax=Linnemannia exigua TaxID=604196 RepID=A0AAD4D7Q2_9FUNG|nr:actinin alpha 2 [Linnemannia exigua]